MENTVFNLKVTGDGTRENLAKALRMAANEIDPEAESSSKKRDFSLFPTRMYYHETDPGTVILELQPQQ